MSFLPEEEVANVVRYAAEQNHRKIAALYPATQYGQIIEQALIRASQKNGVSIAASDRYSREGLSVSPAIQKAAQAVNTQGADTVLIPESGETLRQNGLVTLEHVCDVSSVVVANRAALKLKRDAIAPILAALDPATRASGTALKRAASR